MANHSSPTVVRPNIPADAITMLELMLLTEIFEWERDADDVYFFSTDGTPAEIELDAEEVRRLIDMAPEGPSHTITFLREQLAAAKVVDGRFSLDLSGFEEGRIFQDILQRCPQIDHVSIDTAWTCSRMRPDGFGGAVIVVTRGDLRFGTTQQIEELLLDQAEFGEIARAPGQGEHKVLLLPEPDVRAMVVDMEEAARSCGEQTMAVTDADLRQGCLEAIESCDLDAYRQNLTFAAAQAATRIAWARAA